MSSSACSMAGAMVSSPGFCPSLLTHLLLQPGANYILDFSEQLTDSASALVSTRPFIVLLSPTTGQKLLCPECLRRVPRGRAAGSLPQQRPIS
jgi:hypothetical protein